MGINRGKQFEDKLRKQFEKIPDTLCLRLYDVTMGYSKINNPCDLIVYKDGTLNLFELKAIHGNTLNFKSHIRENQWNELLKYSKIGGVNAGIICWFIDKNATLFIPIETLENMKKLGKKSFNVNETGTRWYNENGVKWGLDYFYIEAKKKRTFFEYDLKSFLDKISYVFYIPSEWEGINND